MCSPLLYKGQLFLLRDELHKESILSFKSQQSGLYFVLTVYSAAQGDGVSTIKVNDGYVYFGTRNWNRQTFSCQIFNYNKTWVFY